MRRMTCTGALLLLILLLVLVVVEHDEECVCAHHHHPHHYTHAHIIMMVYYFETGCSQAMVRLEEPLVGIASSHAGVACRARLALRSLSSARRLSW